MQSMAWHGTDEPGFPSTQTYSPCCCLSKGSWHGSGYAISQREREMNDRDPEKGFVKLTWRDHKRFSDSYLISYLCRLSFPIFVKAASADHPRIRTGAEGCK